MLTRRRKKMSKAEVRRVTGRTYLECSACHMEEVEVSTDVTSVVCSVCVQKLVAPPPKPVQKSNKPRGWHLKPFIELDGVVYSKGVEITDADEIKRLRKESDSTTVVESPPPKKPVKKTTKKAAKKTVTKTTKKGVKRARTSR
jgi:ribosomal protein S27E